MQDLSDDQLLRYSRHILLEGFDVAGQSALLRSHALVVGAGGLGCAAALFLASSGVGTITLVDADAVDFSNLQRQIGHTQVRVGQLKVDSLAQAMREINPEVRIITVPERVEQARLNELVRTVDVVLDCCDNFSTRHAINAACVTHRIPLVSGAALGLDAQLSVYDTRHTDSPCYACVFPAEAEPTQTRCATTGVLAPLVGVIGSLQALESIKLLSGLGTALTGQLMMCEALRMQWTTLNIQRRSDCQVCQHRQH